MCGFFSSEVEAVSGTARGWLAPPGRARAQGLDGARGWCPLQTVVGTVLSSFRQWCFRLMFPAAL